MEVDGVISTSFSVGGLHLTKPVGSIRENAYEYKQAGV